MTTTKLDIRSRTKGRSSAASLRRRILASQNKYWRAGKLSGPESTTQHILTELERKGELLHIRKGLYWRGLKTPLGMSPPPSRSLTIKIAKTNNGIGPAGLSASNMLRLSTQIPKHSWIAIPSRAPTPTGTIKFVSRAARTGRVTAKLTPLEVALLETLQGWDRIIEIPIDQAWERMCAMLIANEINATRLAIAARTEPAIVRIRLSALLSNSGFDEDAIRIPGADERTITCAKLSTATSGLK